MDTIRTTSEVAEYLRLSRATVALYASAGMFPGAFKIGINWRFPQAAIDSFIESRHPTKKDPQAIAPRSRRAQKMRRKTA